MAREPYSVDRIRPVDADLAILGIDDEWAPLAGFRPVRTAMDANRSPKPHKCVPRRSWAWTWHGDLDGEPDRPAATLSAKEAARRAVKDYRAAAKRLGIGGAI